MFLLFTPDSVTFHFDYFVISAFRYISKLFRCVYFILHRLAPRPLAPLQLLADAYLQIWVCEFITSIYFVGSLTFKMSNDKCSISLFKLVLLFEDNTTYLNSIIALNLASGSSICPNCHSVIPFNRTTLAFRCAKVRNKVRRRFYISATKNTWSNQHMIPLKKKSFY